MGYGFTTSKQSFPTRAPERDKKWDAIEDSYERGFRHLLEVDYIYDEARIIQRCIQCGSSHKKCSK